jgi:DNA-directed RNA polymerase II subunit RPB2
MNQSAIDRGLFHSIFYRTYRGEERKSQAGGTQVQEEFTRPNPKTTLGMKGNNYHKLDKNGFARKNERVRGNDAIIGKTTPIKRKGSATNYSRCCSTALRSNESGFIDNIILSTNGEGYRFAKIRVRSPRRPTIGDKHSSRHGQKGTVGIVYSQQDMPCTRNGIVPDVIMNPHAVPSRMTIGQVVECLTAKACSLVGKYGDATGFGKKNFAELGNILEESGYHRHGEEVLYNGRTGRQLKVNIYIGPTYYQRLKHMVEDKIHSRATGPNVILTRQPAEGRSRDGGLRVGEMERDVILAHGAAQFLKETFCQRSDDYRMYVCKQCGLVAAVNEKKNIYMCKNCNNHSYFSELRIPYAMKLFIQELESMSVAPRLVTE